MLCWGKTEDLAVSCAPCVVQNSELVLGWGSEMYVENFPWDMVAQTVSLNFLPSFDYTLFLGTPVCCVEAALAA